MLRPYSSSTKKDCVCLYTFVDPPPLLWAKRFRVSLKLCYMACHLPPSSGGVGTVAQSAQEVIKERYNFSSIWLQFVFSQKEGKMQGEGHVTFRHFRFDPTSESLWRGTRAIALRPKTFAVLRLLVERAGQLVTKEELLDAVWPDTSVSDVVPIVCVRELRQALGDQADAPHFIETVPRRGYRFIALLSTAPPVVSRQLSVVGKKKSAASSQLTTPLIG